MHTLVPSYTCNYYHTHVRPIIHTSESQCTCKRRHAHACTTIHTWVPPCTHKSHRYKCYHNTHESTNIRTEAPSYAHKHHREPWHNTYTPTDRFRGVLRNGNQKGFPSRNTWQALFQRNETGRVPVITAGRWGKSYVNKYGVYSSYKNSIIRVRITPLYILR